MTLDLLYGKDGRSYMIMKRDLASGALTYFTQRDLEELLEQEAEAQRQETLRLKVNETAKKLREGGYGP